MREVVCTRPSTLAKALDAPGDGLFDYHAATTLEAVLKHDDLLHTAQLVDTGAGWRAYKPIVEAAKLRRGKREANAGTNVHKAVEVLVAGRDPSLIPGPLLAPARLVLAELEALGVEVVRSEAFIGTLGVFPEDLAGTADLVVRHEGRLYIADIKTTEAVGANARYQAMQWTAQLTIYSQGRPFPAGYEPERDRWQRPVVDADLLGRWPAPMDRKTGIIIEVARDAGGVASHELSLDLDLVGLACHVRAARKVKRLE
jgi:hypothetical protein